jgi:hypothetical protein
VQEGALLQKGKAQAGYPVHSARLALQGRRWQGCNSSTLAPFEAARLRELSVSAVTSDPVITCHQPCQSVSMSAVISSRQAS